MLRITERLIEHAGLLLTLAKQREDVAHALRKHGPVAGPHVPLATLVERPELVEQLVGRFGIRQPYYVWSWGAACLQSTPRARACRAVQSLRYRRGSSTVNVAPCEGTLCTCTLPPCALTISCTIHSPSPKPP